MCDATLCQALEVLAPIDERMRVQLSQIYSCFVTTYYVMGFAYLMLHRMLVLYALALPLSVCRYGSLV